MAVTPHVYTMLPKSLSDKKIDLDTDTLKCMLLSAYTVGTTQDTAQYVSDVKAVATEASGTGYTAGGLTLSNVAFTRSGHVYTLDCDDPVWAASTISAAYALFYGINSTTNSDATNCVMAYWDLGGTQSSTSASFTLTINASGLITFTGS